VYLFLVGFRIIFRFDVFFSVIWMMDGISVVTRAKICFLRKERVRVRVVSKRANSTGRQRYIHLHPPNVSLQSRVAVRVVRKPARIRDIKEMRICFFLSPAFCLKLWFLPQKIRKIKEILLLLRKQKTKELLTLVQQQYQRDSWIFFSN
jgi:hypothetical protein